MLYALAKSSPEILGNGVWTIGDNGRHQRRFRCYVIRINWCVSFTNVTISDDKDGNDYDDDDDNNDDDGR